MRRADGPLGTRRRAASPRLRSARRVLLALGLGGALSCWGDSGPTCSARGFRRPRPSPVIHLVDLPARVSGEARSEDRTLARWEGEALEAWRVERGPKALRLISPRLERGLEGVGGIELTLAPGGAGRLDLILIVAGDPGEAYRRMRRVEIPLARNSPSDAAVTVRADLQETLRGNWGDAARSGRLLKLELHLDAVEPAAVRLHAVSLQHEAERRPPFAAEPRDAEQGGLLRPSWWVRAGASAEFDLELPAAKSGGLELRWHDGSLEGAGARRVELVLGEETTLLQRSSGDEGWGAKRVSLGPWAGRPVRLRLATDGQGIGLFGAPRIVLVDGREQPPDVLVYMIDALRADHLGAFGADLPGFSPVLDRLAKEGVAFGAAISSSSWTKPVIVTLMTGVPPTTHRVGSRTASDRLPDSVALVQERFRRAGWRTGSFSANPMGSTLSGLERGFDATFPPRFWSGRPELGPHPSARQLHAELLRWIDEEPDRPFFAYVHVLEVHQYFRRALPGVRAPGYRSYLAAVRAADAELGRLLEALAERGRDGNLLVVVLADHGESFGRHGVTGHGTSLFQDQIHVPLIFWSARGLRAGLVRDPVGLADVAPSLIDLFGLPSLTEAEGESLLSYLVGSRRSPRRSLASALLHFPQAPDAPQQFSLVDPQARKVILTGDGRSFTFDLQADPSETGIPVPDAEDVRRELERLMAEYPNRARAFQERHGAPHAGRLGAEEVERLRALGYVE